MRGKVAAVDAYHKGGRITPAHAGKRLLGRLPGMGGRITPAHAGKRLLGRLPGMGGPDHPRACGEKTPVRFYENGVPGSPPRMRGKGVKARYERVAVGITPAHAGKRRRSPSTPRRWKDHPRACGEKSISRPKSGPSTGSPPRMRRKDVQNLRAGRVPGITPAYAGKSLWATWRRFCSRDHPRVCGEKLASRISKPAQSGSPPRMRGKGATPPVEPKSLRITPAYAGKSLLLAIAATSR